MKFIRNYYAIRKYFFSISYWMPNIILKSSLQWSEIINKPENIMKWKQQNPEFISMFAYFSKIWNESRSKYFYLCHKNHNCFENYLTKPYKATMKIEIIQKFIVYIITLKYILFYSIVIWGTYICLRKRNQYLQKKR